MSLLFPFQEYWWFYGGFTAFVLVLLALDLGVFHRKDHAVSFREATIWTAAWMSLTAGFSGLLYQYTLAKFDAPLAKRVTLEFLTGYVVEQSLSVTTCSSSCWFSSTSESRRSSSTAFSSSEFSARCCSAPSSSASAPR
jgi:hypothetical protein